MARKWWWGIELDLTPEEEAIFNQMLVEDGAVASLEELEKAADETADDEEDPEILAFQRHMEEAFAGIETEEDMVREMLYGDPTRPWRPLGE